jgi:cytosine/adenosine deaminase-related metal-dependent hydrolase
MNHPSFASNAQEIHRREVHRFNAAAVVDAGECSLAPASLLVGFQPRTAPRVLAIGTPSKIDAHPASARAITHDLSRHLLVPGLVNAHTHLDLTHIGPRSHDPAAGFLPWVDMVRRERRTDAEGIGASVREGIALSLRGGTVAVGDIAGSPRGAMTLTPWRELVASGLLGTSFLEFFGIGRTMPKARAEIEAFLASAEWREAQKQGRAIGVTPGLQPHAPYSVDRRLYQWIAEHARAESIPLATHLGETTGERRFVRDGDGPNLDFLRSLGIWDESIAGEIGLGSSPIAHLDRALVTHPMLAAHVHDASDADIEILARAGTSVAYCPRAAEYFASPSHFGPHRYDVMIRSGLNVCLGTDSILNLPARDVERRGISILDEMRLLSRRDGAPPATLLSMGTVNGAKAIGLDPASFLFKEGATLAGLVAIEIGSALSGERALEQALRSDAKPELLFHANLCCSTVHARATRSDSSPS